MSSERLARIKPALQSWVDRGTIGGASMLVARRGKLVYHEQVGYLDRESSQAMPADALFRIYSMTKPIVCTALMTLYEEGHFQLITPAAKFIPALAQLKVLQQAADGTTTTVALQQPITMGDLMRHTAGFTYDFLVDSPVAALYREAQLAHKAGETLEQFVQALTALPLAYQPGSCWHYSVSIDVAAYLIEVITGKPLRDALQERLFTPLGMVDTDFCVPANKAARLASMYGVGDLFAPNMTLLTMFEQWQAGVVKKLDVEASYPLNQPATFGRGGHGLYSTTQDYLRFAQMLLNHGTLDGARILGRKTVELMHANHLPPAQLPLTLSGLPIPGYGFGLGSRTLLEVGLAQMPGSVGEFGWAGAASTYYWIDPAEQMVGLFMTQYQGADEPDRDFRVLAYQAIID
ncbi:MAG: beta-lactamase family protein [Caldilineaceae bacterium]|nr:beta-lactamase family protein [Caldilineaceae bacterium]